MKKFILAARNGLFLWAGILILTLSLVSCQGSSPRPASETPTAIESPIATTKPTLVPTGTFTLSPSPTFTFISTSTFTLAPTPEGMLYGNDFNGVDTGLSDWIIHEDVDERHFQFEGPYTFELPREAPQSLDGGDGQMLYAIYDKALPTSDLTIDEEMNFAGQGSASHALICRFSEAGWYEMSLASTGHWEIRLVKKDAAEKPQTTLLAQGDSEAIKNGLNKVAAGCIADSLSLSVNGTDLAAIQDASLPEGNLVGFTYFDDAAADIHLEVSKFVVKTAAGKALVEFTLDRNSFYFAWRLWAVTAGMPGNIRSLIPKLSRVEGSNGQAAIHLSAPGRWIAIYPHELSHDIEVTVDVDMDNHNGDGFGVLCRWSEANGGYAMWFTRDYVVTSPYEMDENGNPLYYGASAEYATTQWANLLSGTKRHLTVRCQGPLVKMYINGQLVSSHDIQHFPDVSHSNKGGLMVGLLFQTLMPEGSSASIDNLLMSNGNILLTPIPSPTP